MKTIIKIPAAKAYSYLRYSTPEQGLGDSVRRQVEGAEAHAKKIGLPLDNNLRMADRGISGFTGRNRESGALGEFLRQVEAGKVSPGSVLIVENIDRLSRQGFLKSFEIIKTLIDRDIAIHTLRPEQIIDRKAVNGPAMYQLLGQMMLANEESVKKAERVGRAWANKRTKIQPGSIYTKRAPAWLRIADGKFEPIPEAAMTVKKIFDLKLSGLGRRAIEKTLNKNAAWKPKPRRGKSSGWYHSYIAKILSNPAVIGQFQPHSGRLGNRVPSGEPIENYFPAVVDPDTFHAVQKQLAVNKGKGGETGKAQNLFPHLATCAYCAGPMILINKGTGPKGGSYLICDRGRRGAGCKAHSIGYAEVESTIIKNCLGLRPEQILPNPKEQESKCAALRKRLAGIEGRLENIDARTINLMDQIEQAATPGMRERYELRIVELDKGKAILEPEQKALEEELEKAEQNRQSVTSWQRGLKDLGTALAKRREDIDLRLRMRAHLRELVERIEIFAIGFIKQAKPGDAAPSLRQTPRRRGEARTSSPCQPITPRDVEEFAGYIEDVVADLHPAKLRDKSFQEFLRWVTSRRMSRHGRFIRVYFKSGVRRDLVPRGSIASGRALEIDPDGTAGWRMTWPEIDLLYKQFLSWKRHQVRPATTSG